MLIIFWEGMLDPRNFRKQDQIPDIEEISFKILYQFQTVQHIILLLTYGTSYCMDVNWSINFEEMNNFHHIKYSYLVCDIMEANMAISRILTCQSFGIRVRKETIGPGKGS